MKRRSFLSLALALAMLVSMVSVSASADETPTMPTLPNNTLTLTVNVPNFGTDAQGTVMQELWQEKMEEYLGITLDITWNETPWSDFRTNEKILLQTDDIPDVSTYSQGTFVNEYGADGVVLNIMDYADYMTYYPEYIESTNGGMDFATNPDGSAYYFMDGFYNPDDNTGAQSFTAFAYRFDVLQEFGLTPATTLDEFTQLCADLQALIDDGSIPNAKYVLNNSDKNYAFYRGFVGIFHTWDTLYWNGTEWAFGPIEDNFRSMLKYLNSLYEAGYIDPEFATADSTICTEKATTGNVLIVPTLWAGMARYWNSGSLMDGLEWGLAFLPENSDYGTPWKWGSKQPSKSLSKSMGIIISADTEYPEWVVKLIDYQYSDEMVYMMNWGVEDVTYTLDGTDHQFTSMILDTDDPVQTAADYGIMSSAACRTGIPFIPQTFESMTELIPQEPWWNEEDGYYTGQYWIESGRLGGEDSVSPYDRPPVYNLTDKQSTAVSELQTNCETYAKENALKFIIGELDVDSDADWNAYVDGVKSQVYDFDGTLQDLYDNSVLD